MTALLGVGAQSAVTAALLLAIATQGGCNSNEPPATFLGAWATAAKQHDGRALLSRFDVATQQRLRAAIMRDQAKALQDAKFKELFAYSLAPTEGPPKAEAADAAAKAPPDEIAARLVGRAAARCYPVGWDVSLVEAKPAGDGLELTVDAVDSAGKKVRAPVLTLRRVEQQWRVPAEVAGLMDPGGVAFGLSVRLPFCGRLDDRTESGGKQSQGVTSIDVTVDPIDFRDGQPKPPATVAKEYEAAVSGAADLLFETADWRHGAFRAQLLTLAQFDVFVPSLVNGAVGGTTYRIERDGVVVISAQAYDDQHHYLRRYELAPLAFKSLP